jgi:FAD-linked sulfhydryl oxidase
MGRAQPAAAPAASASAATAATGGRIDGFPPGTWGPGLWFLLHAVAAAYPEAPSAEDKRRHMAFIKSLAPVLPCAGCRKGMAALVSCGPLKLTACVFKDRFSFFRWTVEFHNAVNVKAGKRVNHDWVFWYKHYTAFRAA